MTKRELVTYISIKTGLTLEMSAKALNSVVEAITESLVKNDRVLISDFGAFEVRSHNSRIGRNPYTGETMQLEAVQVPAFKASKALKKLVNSRKEQ